MQEQVGLPEKRQFEPPVMEIVLFETEDVIIASWGEGDFPLGPMK